MNNVVIDTHSLLWFTNNDARLSEKAKISLRNASKIYVPTIVLLELLYLMKKLKLDKQFPKLLHKLNINTKYVIASLDLEIVEASIALSSKLEMHDNIIVVTAESLGIPLITKDPQIQKVYKNTIW